MICPTCGVSIEENVTFCPNCGADLVASRQQVVDQAAQVNQAAPTPEAGVPNTTAYASQAAPQQTLPTGPGPYTGTGTPSMVLGILSIVLSGFGIVGIVLGIIAIVKGGKSLATDPGDSRARAGRITGIIGLVFSILAIVAAGILMAMGLWMVNDPEVQQYIGQTIEASNTASNDQTSNTPSAATSAATSDSVASSATSNASTSESAPAPSEGQALDTWADECLDANNNPTVYSLLDLKGFQLETLLQQLGWKYSADQSAWLGANGAGLAVLQANGTPLSDTEIGELDKGGVGTPAVYVLIQPGYATVDDALAKTNVVNEDSFVIDDESGMAVVYGPNMNEHFAVISVAENEASWLLFNKEAVEAGAVQAIIGNDITGTSINDIWKSITGRDVGAV